MSCFCKVRMSLSPGIEQARKSMECVMKRLIVGMLVLAVVAAPCIYDVLSPEPSPMAALATMLGLVG